MLRARDGELRTGVGYTTELAGRDRAKFFRRPVQAHNALPSTGIVPDESNLHFAASCPSLGIPAEQSLRDAARQARLGERPGSSRFFRSPAALQSRYPPARPHHLPRLQTTSKTDASTTSAVAAATGSRASQQQAATSNNATGGGGGSTKGCDVGQQTDYRENETQTDPYSPDYVIPDGAPMPEILQLRNLHWGSGLPAGKEEVDLIQRLRRRRDVEAALPTGTDADSIERRYQALHALEEQEWADREAHVAQLQERRIAKIQRSLLEREQAHEEMNQARLERIRAESMAALRQKLERLEGRRMAHTRRGLDKRMAVAATEADDMVDAKSSTANEDAGATAGAASLKPQSTSVVTQAGRSAAMALLPPSMRGTRRPDLITAYVQYGTEAAPPTMDGQHLMDVGYSNPQAQLRAATQNYDVRPTLLTTRVGAEEVEAEKGPQIEQMPQAAFVVPEAEAIRRLPTLYQRHEATRVVQSLEYAHRKIQAAKHPVPLATQQLQQQQRVLDLYRASPRPQRPETPELEVEGQDAEEQEEACILLQRLLRGRAVQNDYFEGKERCRGLIAELQAASNAKYAERSLVNVKEREELVAKQEAMVHNVLDAAQGDIVQHTLGYLFQELTRQQDVQRIEVLRGAAEEVRRTREAAEIARREVERLQRDREEVQYAAYTRATEVTIAGYLNELRSAAVAETALATAVAAERTRQAALAPPRSPSDPVAREDVVCDMLDGFVLPTVVDMIDLRATELDKMAPASVARDVMRDALHLVPPS